MKTTAITLLFLLTILLSSFTSKKDNKIVSQPITEIQTKIERDSIISYAKQYLGTRYLYASSNPNKGFDCSGFVYYVFNNFDLTLPRSSSGYKNIGKTLKPEEFKVGDVLVFYGYKDKSVIGHVGIICEANGMQSKFIHASSGKAQKVTITGLDEEHYTKRFYKCVDVLSE
ncbi:C40 family peptidase [Flavobacterium hydrophilum]|uniref:Glycoside hydrolase n=1 Tax=Flavobacterium hydrophilum TaxID=2211445 RepID=A0A2V4C4Y5_9FLAO|nr:C40 family peptidase [Flavobacterium hydrophilum]PXY45742.1 glycoside hydrolase [Flavobacterium hydrophilum]